ncbi:MAG: acetyl-CoA carboxylase carboxyl transferase subunit alpha, partial [Bacteroidota bacterium]|nr:acetyl-CoA carboxylase carboxyl transferase subunit alpha [Bacteroidota bacterium]
AKDMLKQKLIDGIIKEPIGGAHAEPEKMAKKLKSEIKKHIKALEAIDVEERISIRTEKFSNMGN